LPLGHTSEHDWLPSLPHLLASRVASFYYYSMSLPADPEVYGNLIGASGSMELELPAPLGPWHSVPRSPVTSSHASPGASSSNSSAQFSHLRLSATHFHSRPRPARLASLAGTVSFLPVCPCAHSAPMLPCCHTVVVFPIVK
jgi:hypothetical protein